ncbi:recombinase family protein [Nocardioides flavescens]|uniref:Resolvase/invertase-type recombinase catalytic domain-containing protein n=1 Tax=Nocardioides flavescens TaxID=2691959 RepID=A0A6L7EWN8_9ACTN|nr:recombinase family protein [Nocardioides flavescens]MXG88439.1 hypothetical protein [Nocardioides flavescens]
MSAKAAVIYARTASRATVDSAALDQQIAVCELGAAEIGAEVVGIFAEGGVSGNTADRPVLNALLARLAEQDVDLLICLDPTRIARSFEVYRAITEYADMLGVRVVFVNDLSRRERANGSAQ